ncbi:MAG: hypothetical protein HY721_15090, partial [Planctomycetes bacterium]|nr:hypothetical protein [Planctomycetota bacterium]
AVLRLQQVGPTCLHLLVDNTVPISGGEIAVAYDPGVLSVTAVERGPDFPLGGGEASAELNPAVNCDSPAPLAGFTARWTSSPNGPALLQPGEHRVLKVEIEPAPGAEPGGLSSLAFVECLGNPPARNRVLGEGGTPLEAAPIDGQARVASYQRPGDCNQDSEVDVSDAVCLLLHLFAGVPMELPCGDHAATDPANVSLLDANGDGTVDLSDAVHALSFLFLGGPPHVLGTGCVEIQGCPATCIGCEPPGPVVLPRVHDLAADWSDLQNPNGPWSYNRSPRTAIAKQLPDWDPGACCFVEPQPAWALAEQPSPGHVPVWMKVVSSVVAPGELDLPAGTVAMHGSEDSTAGVTWTSPEDGLVEVSGAV